MTCEYNMTVRSSTSMNKIDCGKCPHSVEDCSRKGCITAGGIIRPVIAANQKIPGPSIIVCENDRIIVNVKNQLRTETLSIHWHGIHQTGSLFMDGLPFVSQYPIQPLGSFRYEFIAEPHGTQLWHGHSGFQEADGLFGVLNVRRKEPDYIQSLYDFDLPEHTILIWHWFDKPTGDELQTVLHQNESIYGYGFLINGKAALKKHESADGYIAYTPQETFFITKAKRYRFRLVYNSAIYCPLQISVDNHKMKVFASDTSQFQPVEVDSLMISSGERFDFVLTGDQPEKCYWMRIRALGDCGEKKNKLHQGALVCYENRKTFEVEALSYEQGKRTGVLLNPAETLTQDYSKNKLIFFKDLNSTEIEVNRYNSTPNVTFYIEINTKPIYELRYPGPWHQFNNISFLFPNQSFLRNQLKMDEVRLCDADHNTTDSCGDKFCGCTYIKKIPTGSLVELVLFDTSKNRDQDHPIHMHGYQFHVVSEGAIGTNLTLADIKYRNENGLIPKKLENAPSKDTVSVPNNGFIVLRFVADNVGFWIFHCHVTNHMELGMALLFQVGTREEILNMCTNSNQCDSWYNEGAHLHFNCVYLFIIFLIYLIL
ncbi:uncharacterized protein isoform X2 [Rhodnius prolixus]